MNTTTASAGVVRMRGSARWGAGAATSSTVPPPSSSAAAARKARLKSSSVRSDGRAPMDGYKVQKTSGGEVPRRSVRPLPLQRAYRQTGAPPASPVVAGAAGGYAPPPNLPPLPPFFVGGVTAPPPPRARAARVVPP